MKGARTEFAEFSKLPARSPFKSNSLLLSLIIKLATQKHFLFFGVDSRSRPTCTGCIFAFQAESTSQTLRKRSAY